MRLVASKRKFVMGFTAIVYIVIPPAKKFELVTKVGTAALSPPRYLQDAADA
jgi:hypothetical protein